MDEAMPEKRKYARHDSTRMKYLLTRLAALAFVVIWCIAPARQGAAAPDVVDLPRPAVEHTRGEPEGFGERLSEAALERTNHHVSYDGSYRSIPYPRGDVPDTVGVCTDLVIRAYRKLGIDLQKDVHEEMKAHFEAFPASWGLSGPDPNIDHRRVPNLQTLFSRRGVVLDVTDNPEDYVTGDLVTWMLYGRLPHIGIVAGRRSRDDRRPLIVHNIGRGPDLEDMVFTYPITGHYRYYGSR
jgi:uncharacterized protein YijF (DUF1287 family)